MPGMLSRYEYSHGVPLWGRFLRVGKHTTLEKWTVCRASFGGGGAKGAFAPLLELANTA